MPTYITLRDGYIEICFILLHLYCLAHYIYPPTLDFSTSDTPLQSIHDSLRSLLLYYVPNCYPLLFEILSFRYTSDSGKNMKIIKFNDKDVFSIAYAIVAPINLNHILRIWMFCLRIWNHIEAPKIHNFMLRPSLNFKESLVAWVGATCLTIYVTVPCILLMANMAGNVVESLADILLKTLGLINRDGECERLFWFRAKWGNTWGKNVFWWWESNPMLLVTKFREEVILFVWRPKGSYMPDRRSSLLPTASLARSKAMLDFGASSSGKEKGKEKGNIMHSLGLSNSYLDVKKYHGRPTMVQRFTAEKGGMPMAGTERGEGGGKEEG